MKQKLIALLLISVMVASTLTAIAATTATPVAAATSTKTSLTVSNANPAIGEKVTFTAQLLKWTGKTWVPMPRQSTPQLKIGHGVNSVIVPDVAKTTDNNGKITWTKSWSSTGVRTYYATFAGNPTYTKFSSAGTTVTVQRIPTKATLTVSKTNPVIGEKVTFTAQLLKWTGKTWVPMPRQSTPQLKIGHFVPGGVIVTDVAKTTDNNGKITWTKSWSSTGEYWYYAIFTGNPTYGTAKHTYLTMTVQPKFETLTTLTVSNNNPAFNEKVTFTAQLKRWNSSSRLWEVVPYAQLKIGHLENGVIVPDVAQTTDNNGKITWTTSWSKGDRFNYYATFAGNSTHSADTSQEVTVALKQKIQTTFVFRVYNHITNGTFEFVGALAFAEGKTVSIYYGPSPTSLSSHVEVTTGYHGGFQGWIPEANYYQARFLGDSTYAAETSYIVQPVAISN